VYLVQSLVKRIADDLAAAKQHILVSATVACSAKPVTVGRALGAGAHATWKPFCRVSPSTGEGSLWLPDIPALAVRGVGGLSQLAAPSA